MLHVTLAICNAKNTITSSHFCEVKSVTLPKIAVCLRCREPAVSDNADGRCSVISNTTAKGTGLARFLTEKLHFLEEAMSLT